MILLVDKDCILVLPASELESDSKLVCELAGWVEKNAPPLLGSELSDEALCVSLAPSEVIEAVKVALEAESPPSPVGVACTPSPTLPAVLLCNATGGMSAVSEQLAVIVTTAV